MKKLATLVLSVGAFVVLPSVSHAYCLKTGQLSRVSVYPGATSATFYVTTSTPGQPSFSFSTADEKVLSAIVAAETRHLTVEVIGNLSACKAPVNGVSAGGAVVAFTMAP